MNTAIAMKRKFTVPALVALCMALAGCVTPEGNVDAKPPVAGGEGIAPNAASVSAARAKALFDGVCGASQPRFENAPQLMAAMGFTRQSASGTVYSQTENASFQIQGGPGVGKTCSMVIATEGAPEAVRAAVMGLNLVTGGPAGAQYIALYGQRKILIAAMPPRKLGNVTYMNFRMLSER